MEPEAQLREMAVMDRSGAEQDSALLMSFDVARSVYNVSVWRSYLPVDCVDAMIGMGWNYST
jgi:hypothetical protein